MTKVGIIMGGYSSEYKISLISGNVVYNNLDSNLFEGYRIHILTDKWVYVNDKEQEFPIDKNDFSTTVEGQKIKFDVIFNAQTGALVYPRKIKF